MMRLELVDRIELIVVMNKLLHCIHIKLLSLVLMSNGDRPIAHK